MPNLTAIGKNETAPLVFVFESDGFAILRAIDTRLGNVSSRSKNLAAFRSGRNSTRIFMEKR